LARPAPATPALSMIFFCSDGGVPQIQSIDEK
jgi:hypothetical protein